jgi:hypothetical protein
MKTRRLVFLFGVLAVGLGAVAIPQDAASVQPPAAASVAEWVKTDLRAPSPHQVRLAAAKRAVFCQGKSTVGLGVPVTLTMMWLSNAPIVPDYIASALACSFDAPVGTTCEQIEQCEGTTGSAFDVATCDGPLLRGKLRSSKNPVLTACHAFGADCYQTPLQGLCGVGTCPPGFTYGCEGTNTFVACMHGVLTKVDCGDRMDCGPDPVTGMIGCQPSGPPCQPGPGTCRGPTAVNCRVPPDGQPREVQIPCGEWGLGCEISPATLEGRDAAAVCALEPLERVQCNAFVDKATCDGDRLRVCVTGHWWTTTCSELGKTGVCTPGAGVNGEAGCR